MLFKLPLNIAENILNKYLQLDPESTPRVAVLTGKVVAIELQPFGFSFYLLVVNDRIQLATRYDKAADVILRGSMLDFLRLSADSSSVGLLANNIAIIGDTTIAEQFKELFAHLEIDWEEQLSHVAGDVVARQMGNFFRTLSRWAKQSVRIARQDLTEYLQEEIRLVPPREELQDFFSEIDRLRNDVERTEMRINRLKQQLTE